MFVEKHQKMSKLDVKTNLITSTSAPASTAATAPAIASISVSASASASMSTGLYKPSFVMRPYYEKENIRRREKERAGKTYSHLELISQQLDDIVEDYIPKFNRGKAKSSSDKHVWSWINKIAERLDNELSSRSGAIDEPRDQVRQVLDKVEDQLSEYFRLTNKLEKDLDKLVGKTRESRSRSASPNPKNRSSSRERK